VNYSPTAIYLHFKDKEELIRELCRTDFLALASQLKAIGAIADPLERLRQLGLGYVRFALHYPNHYQLMFMTAQMPAKTTETGLEAGNPEQDAYAGLKQMVSAAHAEHCFREELTDPDLIAQTLWAGLHGVCSLEIAKRHDCWVEWRPLEERVAQMQEVMMRGLIRNTEK
jgi:AcrR family transcriptional regulator